MSFETVKRTFSKLEKQGYLITGNFNKDPRDKTKWYTIDNEKLFHLYEEIEFKKRQNETKALFENVDNSVGYEQVISIRRLCRRMLIRKSYSSPHQSIRETKGGVPSYGIVSRK